MIKVGNWWNWWTVRAANYYTFPFSRGYRGRKGFSPPLTCSFSRERRVRERRGAAGGRRKDLWPHTGINMHKHCGGEMCIYIYICKLVASEIRGWSRSDSVGTPSGQSRLPRHPTIYGSWRESGDHYRLVAGFMPSVTANFYPLQPSSISLSPFRIRMDASLPLALLYRPILTGPRPLDQILPSSFFANKVYLSISTPWESCYIYIYIWFVEFFRFLGIEINSVY